MHIRSLITIYNDKSIGQISCNYFCFIYYRIRTEIWKLKGVTRSCVTTTKPSDFYEFFFGLTTDYVEIELL